MGVNSRFNFGYRNFEYKIMGPDFEYKIRGPDELLGFNYVRRVEFLESVLGAKE